jgi:hypothetical protein
LMEEGVRPSPSAAGSKWVALGLLAILVLGAASFAAASDVAAPVPYSGIARRTFIKTSPWESFCLADGICGIETTFYASIKTPPQTDRVAIVVTVTLDYQETPNTTAMADLEISTTSGRPHPMPPGPLPLVAPRPGVPTTTTLTWVSGGLPAGGKAYFLSLTLLPHRVPGHRVSISGDQLTAVVDVTPGKTTIIPGPTPSR